jgi:hypothetical protein
MNWPMNGLAWLLAHGWTCMVYRYNHVEQLQYVDLQEDCFLHVIICVTVQLWI